MGHASHCGALLRGRIGVKRVNLHDPTEGIGHIAEILLGAGGGFVHAPAAVEVSIVGSAKPRPVVTSRRFTADAITTKGSDFFSCPNGIGFATMEITSPVFFAAEVGAPGGVAMTAVIQGATGLFTTGGRRPSPAWRYREPDPQCRIPWWQ